MKVLNFLEKHEEAIVIIVGIFAIIATLLLVLCPKAQANSVLSWVGDSSECQVGGITTDGEFIYAGLTNNSTLPAKIVKLNSETMQKIGEWVGTENQTTLCNIFYYEGYIYANLQVIPGQVVQVDVATMQTKDVWVEPIPYYSCCFTAYDNLLLVGNEIGPAVVYWIDTGNMTTKGIWSGVSGDERVMGLADDESNIYATLDMAPGKVVKIDKETKKTLKTWVGADYVQTIVYDNGDVFVGTQSYADPYQVIKIETENMTTQKILTGQAGVRTYGILGGLKGNYLYRPLATNPGSVIMVNTDNLSVEGIWITDSGQSHILSIDFLGDYAYLGLVLSPGQVLKVSFPTPSPLALWPSIPPSLPRPPHPPQPIVNPPFVSHDDGGFSGGSGGGASGEKRFTSILYVQTYDFKLTEDVDVLSIDNVVKISLLLGMQVKNPIGQRVNVITIEKLPGTENVIGSIYDMRLSGTTFTPYALLEMRYDEIFDEDSLIILYREKDAGEWRELASTVNKGIHIITAEIGHLCSYALGVRSTPIREWTITSFAEEYGISENETMRLVALLQASPDDYELSTLNPEDKTQLVSLLGVRDEVD